MGPSTLERLSLVLSASALAMALAVLVRPAVDRAAAPGDGAVRTELFFGRAMPDGATVSDAQWQRFLDEEVTPRLPDGLTVITGRGQYRGDSGAVLREDAMVLIVVHPEKADASNRIEAVRNAYRQRFRQQSVLRVDSRAVAAF